MRLVSMVIVLALGCRATSPDNQRGDSPAGAPSSASASSKVEHADVSPFGLGSLRNGDLVFQTSRSSQSLAVQAATRSAYSHMGIVYVDEKGPQVLEAARTVTLTPFVDWAKRGKDDHVVVKRLADASLLTNDVLAKMKGVGETLVGRPYDLAFAWDDDRIYCSELVFKIYTRGAGIELGELQTFRDFDLEDEVVATKLRERFGQDIPLEETVVSPQSMFADPKLITVFEGTWPSGRSAGHK